MESKLIKMRTELAGNVRYYLSMMNGQELALNELLDKDIELHYTGEIYCICCGTKTYKSFAQGYCYKCFISSPETEDCVLKPELCLAHEGIARDMDYAREHCLQPHFVYLAASSEIKVGITRQSQVPTRWMDQGASAALKLAKVPNRYTAGIVEVELKKHFTDKTNWRAMLSNKIIDSVLLLSSREKAITALPESLRDFIIDVPEIVQINYPSIGWPVKVNSLDFDKTPTIKGKLMAIKGQYLIFANGNVLNIRKFGGYKVDVSTSL